MQKCIRLVLTLFICFFVAISFIPTDTLKAEPHQLTVAEADKKPLSVKTYTKSNSITVELSFPQPTISGSSDYHSVEMQELPKYGAPSEPVLPFKTIKILIPQGKKFRRIDVVPSSSKLLEGRFNVEYGRTPMPISSETTVVDQPNPKIYSSSSPFPETLFSNALVQRLRGYDVLVLTLHPVQYVPKAGELHYFESMNVSIQLEKTDEANPMFRNLHGDKALVQSIVDNPEAVETYTSTSTRFETSNVNSSETYDYVIITKTSLNSSFQPLIDSKIQKGLNATTFLVEDILSDPDYFCDGLFGDGCGTTKFNDTAARVRNFIKDIYLNWGTEYVLLGGDMEIVPKRGVYGFVGTDPITVDRNMPSDLYFGALDGSWDNDNDTVFGEGIFTDPSSPENATAGEEADFFAEVYVGRVPVSTPVEAENFVNKTLWYEQASDDSYFKKALTVGEWLDDETEAGNSKDLVTDIIPQYTTTRLYDRDRTFSKGEVITQLNLGTHVVNHDGHCNPQHALGLSISDVDNLVNTRYHFIYSVGCDVSAFDATDAISEHFIFNPTGAFAFISNTRYGWYIPGTTFGPGEIFDRSFFTVLNNTVRNLGKTLQLSKENQYSSSMSSASRWTYFGLVLFGDPEVEIVTEIEAPTAQFETEPDPKRLDPPTMKGIIYLNGTAKRGTAPGTTFSNFTIEYGRGTKPTSWQSSGIELVANGLNETVKDTLAIWNATLVTPGIYTLRLTVRGENGTIGEDRWIVEILELPAIRVIPQLTETQAGLNFTISVKITSPENLYALDFKMQWNTTLLDYVSHSIYIPVEDYWWGVLHEPISITKNEVNNTAGTYWIAASSSSPADPFSRASGGVVYNMTFHAKTNGTSDLKIFASSLTDQDGQPTLHNVQDGTVDIGPGVHDVAVTYVQIVDTIAGQGHSARINATISNEGTFTETFNVTLKANGTAVSTTEMSLEGLNSMTTSIVWDTTAWAKGNYIISVNITPVEGETDTIDNMLVDGWVSVTIPGDVDGDNDVDIFDIVLITSVYGASEGEPNYIANCDIDNNGIINIFDVVIAAGNYGQGP